VQQPSLDRVVARVDLGERRACPGSRPDVVSGTG
jgi:hypothetical protein